MDMYAKETHKNNFKKMLIFLEQLKREPPMFHGRQRARESALC